LPPFRSKSDAAAQASLAAGQLTTEVERSPSCSPRQAMPPCRRLDQIKVGGYEMALAAALGDDLDAPLGRGVSTGAECRPDGPALPADVEPLGSHVEPAGADRRLARCRRRRGRRPAAARAEDGQRLVSVEGHLWRWDGFIAAAQVSTAAATLPSAAGSARSPVRRRPHAAEAARNNQMPLPAARRHQSEEKRLQLWREAGRDGQTRDVLTAMERQARDRGQDRRRVGREAAPRRRWWSRTAVEAALAALSARMR
jgi:chromosome segregation protein